MLGSRQQGTPGGVIWGREKKRKSCAGAVRVILEGGWRLQRQLVPRGRERSCRAKTKTGEWRAGQLRRSRGPARQDVSPRLGPAPGPRPRITARASGRLSPPSRLCTNRSPLARQQHQPRTPAPGPDQATTNPSLAPSLLHTPLRTLRPLASQKGPKQLAKARLNLDKVFLPSDPMGGPDVARLRSQTVKYPRIQPRLPPRLPGDRPGIAIRCWCCPPRTPRLLLPVRASTGSRDGEGRGAAGLPMANI